MPGSRARRPWPDLDHLGLSRPPRPGVRCHLGSPGPPLTPRVDAPRAFPHSREMSRVVPAGKPMPLRLDSRSPDFEECFRAFLRMKREAAQDVENVVRTIIDDVIARGDAALIELTRKFDRVDLQKAGLRVSTAEV